MNKLKNKLIEKEESDNIYNEKCPKCDNTKHKIIRYWTGRPNFVECLKCNIHWVPKSFKR